MYCNLWNICKVTSHYFSDYSSDQGIFKGAKWQLGSKCPSSYSTLKASIALRILTPTGGYSVSTAAISNGSDVNLSFVTHWKQRKICSILERVITLIRGGCRYLRHRVGLGQCFGASLGVLSQPNMSHSHHRPTTGLSCMTDQ